MVTRSSDNSPDATPGDECDWICAAKRIFSAPRPAHFTNYRHCCECAEHDATLLATNVDNIGLEELGNPGWDPLCFTSPEGKNYYFPALIRLCLVSMHNDFYLEQLLFHLEADGPGDAWATGCTAGQRQFVAAFLEYLIEHFPEVIEKNRATDNLLRCYSLWADA